MASATRLVALDVLRGMAVAGMILANFPGDWGATYRPLQHAEWNGWTLTDMVFPTFLFSVGMALGLSSLPTDRRRLWWRIGRRVLALTLLGLLLEASFNLAVGLAGPRWLGPGSAGLDHLRIPGILQRIAFCYGLAAIIAVTIARRDAEARPRINTIAIAGAIVALLAGYAAAMLLVPVPGYGAGRLDPTGNLAAFIDRAIFTSPHLWPLGWAEPGGAAVYDPEGLLAGLPATANVLFGVLAAIAWQRTPGRAVWWIAAAGAGLMAAGTLLDPLFPINKRLWTSSFALTSTGFSALLLAGLAVALRHRAAMRLAAPFRILGGNAILAFVVSTLLGRVYGFPFAAGSPQGLFNRAMLDLVPDPPLASLICASVMLAVVVLIVQPFHRRGIHFRL